MRDWMNEHLCNQWKKIIQCPNGKWYIITFNKDGTFEYGRPFKTKEEAEKDSWEII